MDASKKIDYIESPTQDIQKTRAFFEQLFGWQFQDFGPDYTAYDDGRMRGGFYKSSAVASVASGSVLVVAYTPKLEACREKVVALGGKIVKDIFSFPGGRRFHFTEPGGSEFAVWSESEGSLGANKRNKPTKWYYRTESVIVALIMLGPFAFPLLWRSPKYNLFWKAVLTVVFTVTMIYLLVKTWDLYVAVFGVLKEQGLV